MILEPLLIFDNLLLLYQYLRLYTFHLKKDC